MLSRLHILQKDLGKGRPNRLIASTALFSIILFFYLLNLVSYFQPTVYPLIDRVTYVTSFVNKYFTNNFFDSLIIIVCTILWYYSSLFNKKKYFLMAGFGATFVLANYLSIDSIGKFLVSISFPSIFLFIIVNKIFKRNCVLFDWNLSVNYISLFGIAVAALSAIVIISYILFPQIPLPSLNFLYYFFLIISIFSPFYLVLIAFSYPFVLTFRTLRSKLRKDVVYKNESIIVKKKCVKWKTKFIHLSIIIFLSVIVTIIPHVSTINKDNQVIGVDSNDYVKFFESMAESSRYNDLFYKAFVTLGDRPLSLLFFFSLASIFSQGNFSSFVENLPLLLGPSLIIAIYFLTFAITRNHLTSVFAALIAIPSHVLIGIYAGLYSNWFALIWGYLALIFLFKLVSEPKKIYYILFSLLLIILIFSHAPTWSIFMYVIGLFLVVVFFKNKRGTKIHLLYAFLSTLPSIVIDIIRLFVINNSGVTQEINFAMTRDVGIHGISTIWHNLIGTTHLTLAGQVANPLILLLVIYWLYTTKVKDNYAFFFIAFFSLFTLPLLFGERQTQSRLLYEIPFEIPAAIALSVLKDKIGRYLPIAICIWLIVISAYMAANFVLVIH